MRVSLADQARPGGGAWLAIALGANLPSPAGPPLATLLAVRPLLETLLRPLPGTTRTGQQSPRWSPLFSTAAVGGPAGQPDYLNAAVLVEHPGDPDAESAWRLLQTLQAMERDFARERNERWGPRSLDLDLLWWGVLHCKSAALELPHPRLLQRDFVLAPLAAIDAALTPPGAHAPVGALLAQLRAGSSEPAPQQLPGRPGWPE